MIRNDVGQWLVYVVFTPKFPNSIPRELFEGDIILKMCAQAGSVGSFQTKDSKGIKILKTSGRMDSSRYFL